MIHLAYFTHCYGFNKLLLNQIRRRKWNWLGHTLRRNNSITKHALQWTDTTRPKRKRASKKLEKDFEKEMWTAGYQYSWRKMQAAAKDRAGWRQVVCGLCKTMFHWERQGIMVNRVVYIESSSRFCCFDGCISQSLTWVSLVLFDICSARVVASLVREYRLQVYKVTNYHFCLYSSRSIVLVVEVAVNVARAINT